MNKINKEKLKLIIQENKSTNHSYNEMIMNKANFLYDLMTVYVNQLETEKELKVACYYFADLIDILSIEIQRKVSIKCHSFRDILELLNEDIEKN